MKSRMMKKVFAGAMSATLVMGMSLTAAATSTTPPTATGTAPIYSFDVESVIVPTALVVAFNPDGLTVKTGDSTTSTDQVLSQSFGILNKSSKDKIVTVTLKVEDLNTDKIDFVSTAAEVTAAGKDDYAVYLAATPASDSNIQVGATPAAITKGATAADLAKVKMTNATGHDVVLSAGDNKIAFKLDKASYKPVSGSEVTLGTTGTNDVSSNYELDDIAAAGKGATAFTFTGSVNDKADWTKITQGIKITATYTFANAESTDAIISGTGAMVSTDAAPSIATTDFAILTAGTDAEINVNLGSGDLKATEVTSVSWNGTNYLGNGYSYADGVVTIPSGSVDYFLSTPSKSCELVIKFNDTAETTKTVTLTAAP